MKYYKIVHGFDDKTDYFPINADELHKAYVIAMNGGKALFESGFFQNRGNDILRIVPDWHRAMGWNKGYKMEAVDYDDIRPLEKQYQETLTKGKLLAEFIIKEKRPELLTKPASLAYQEIKLIEIPTDPKLHKDIENLANKFKVI